MHALSMTEAHQTVQPWAWLLRDREAATLQAASAARWLRVDEGCLWITPREAGAHVQDLWLAAGQSLPLPAGTAWVVEAWPQARLSVLLEAPTAAVNRRDAAPASERWLSGLASALAARLHLRAA